MSKVIPNRVFEDYDPPSDLVTEDRCDTLLIYLPGFKKEQLKVQLTMSRMLKISGERPLGGNKYRRFQKEFRLPSNCDTKEITAKFEGGILHIRQPKFITPVAPLAPSAQPQKGAAEAPPLVQPTHPRPHQLAPPPSPPLPPHPQPQQLVPPPPPLPQPQSQQHASPPLPSPQPQPQQPAPLLPSLSLPQSQQEGARGEEVGHVEENAMKTEETGSKDEKKLDKCGIIQHQRQVGNSGLFRELRKPDNVKRLGVCVIMVLIIAFYISYMFKSFMENGHESVSGYYPEL